MSELSTAYNQLNKTEFVFHSPALFMFLRGKGIRPKKTGINRTTGKTYAVYARTEEIKCALDEWHNNRPKK